MLTSIYVRRPPSLATFFIQLTILCENISQESIQSISEALKSNDRVVKVFLGGRELRREAAVALGGMLEVTPSLQQLT